MKSLKAKTMVLALTFFLVGVIPLIGLFVELRMLSRTMQDEVSRIFQEQSTMHEVQTHFQQMIQAWKNILLRGGDPEARKKYLGEFNENVKQAQNNAVILSKSSDPDLSKQFIDFQETYRLMVQKYLEAYGAFDAQGGKNPKVPDGMVKGQDRASAAMLAQAVRGHDQKLQVLTTEVSGQIRLALLVVTLWIVIGYGGLGVFLWFYLRGIMRPLDRSVEIVEQIAMGDLTKTVRAGGQTETARLAKSINTMAADLRGTFGDLQENASSLAASSEELSAICVQINSGSKDLKEQAFTLASGTGEVSTTIKRVSNAIEDVNERIQSASTSSDELSRNINLVSQAVEQMAEGFSAIGEKVREATHTTGQAAEGSRKASEVMTQLGQSAKDIGEVTALIKNIAGKTNLLALNATIEAASAGEAGRGFAVVANEIKSLAVQSGSAADSITQKIQEVQLNTNQAVDVIGQVTDVVSSINQAVKSIYEVVNAQNQRVMEITSAVSDGAKGSMDIAKVMSAAAEGAQEMLNLSFEADARLSTFISLIQIVNTSIEGNLAASGQIQESSNHLDLMAMKLQGLLAKFRF
ncbi:MAG: methyl-accepting chemotaxis protein [Deltaproteobacteria bacterium]|nr:methyl-accepting chemotaxis protein [Deltaproteobacteria bacterium]